MQKNEPVTNMMEPELLYRPINISRLFIEILVTIALCEGAIMLILPQIAPNVSELVSAFLDSSMLTLSAGPIILWRCTREVRRAERAAEISNSGSHRTVVIVTGMVFILGLLLTTFTTYKTHQNIWTEAKANFNAISTQATEEIQVRITRPVYGLKGARGVYAASKSVERGEFRAYVESRDLAKEFPGVLGFGFIEHVMRKDLQKFIDYERSDEAPDFAVRTSGNSPDLFVIKFIDPLNRNRPAWGWDIGMETERRKAAEIAMRTGEPTITAPIVLVQDEQQRSGFLFMVPIYHNGTNPKTPAQREQAFQGLVYAPIIIDDVLVGFNDFILGKLDYEIYDGKTPTEAGLIFDSDNSISSLSFSRQDNVKKLVPTAMFHAENTIQVGGRVWTLGFTTTPKFESEINTSQPVVVAITGSLMSALVAVIVWTLGLGRIHALRQAQVAHELSRNLTIAKNKAEEALRETQALQSTLNEYTIVSVVDPEGTITEVNDAFCKISGYSREKLLGQKHRILNSGFHSQKFWKEMWDTIASGRPWHAEICNKARDGTIFWIDSIIAPFKSADGKIAKYVSISSDITLRKNHEVELRKLSAVVEQTPAQVVITNTRGCIEYVNSAFVRGTGYSTEEAIGNYPRILKSGMTPVETYTTMWRELAAGREWRGELHNRKKNGELFWELAIISPLRDSAGKISHFLAVKEDISARKAMEDELRSAARTDKLTGLPNRALVCDRLEQAVLRAKRLKDYHFALLFLDFDRFKIINDSLGHEVGDMLLQEISRRLRSVVRSGDSLSQQSREHTTARLGGDEFVVLLDAISNTDDAQIVADRLLEAFAQPYRLGDREVYSTASIGIVTNATPYESAEDMLRDADTAMYEAKLAGKGQYVVFNISMRQRVQNRLHLENDLRKAVESAQLFLMYQPIVSLQTGKIESFEALVRWKHPERGLISPGEFIPIAEDTGLIIPIGEWVLREACSQYATWRKIMGENAPPNISVNLSRNQLLLPTLPMMIRRVLEQSGMEASCLHLEVTESAVMKDSATATRILEAIKEIGVKIDMDDFGTGYSSLSCLHQFPIDVLKIDRSFVANIDRGRDFAALVQAVAQLARNLKISVVAEGIETMDQALVLQSLECEYGQGYLFSKPLMGDKVPTFKVDPLVLPGQAAAELVPHVICEK